jgi:hypothetical protein
LEHVGHACKEQASPHTKRPTNCSQLYFSINGTFAFRANARLALQRGAEILAASPDPSGRHYAVFLKCQHSYASDALHTKFKADEAQFKAINEKEEREQLQSLIKELREANARHRADEMRWRQQSDDPNDAK